MSYTAQRRRGSVQVHTYDRVEALVKLGKTKSAAIETLAAQTGRSVAAVKAAYYAEARRRRTPSDATEPRRPFMPVGRPPQSPGDGGLDAVLDAMVASAERLARIVHAPDRPPANRG